SSDQEISEFLASSLSYLKHTTAQDRRFGGEMHPANRLRCPSRPKQRSRSSFPYLVENLLWQAVGFHHKHRPHESKFRGLPGSLVEIRPVLFSISPCENFLSSLNSRKRSPISMSAPPFRFDCYSASISRIVTPMTRPTISASRGYAKRRTWHFDFG